jgi:hypothetical protein
MDLAHFCSHISRLVLRQRDCRWSDDFTPHGTIVTNADLVFVFLDDLRICSLIPNASLQTCAPFLPRSSSVIARLIRLALDIFDGVCRTPAFRPAGDFQAIVHNASSLVLAPDSNNVQEVDHSAIKSLLGLINDSGLEWPGSLLDSGAGFTSGWGVDGMLGV